jgi:hypothetical protein
MIEGLEGMGVGREGWQRIGFVAFSGDEPASTGQLQVCWQMSCHDNRDRLKPKRSLAVSNWA